jgi:hypothetical protein
LWGADGLRDQLKCPPVCRSHIEECERARHPRQPAMRP